MTAEKWVSPCGRATLWLGDCLDILPTLEPGSIDAVVTDPPAGISFMGKAWDHHKGGRDEWVAWLTGVMRECLRVLKPGGHALVWALPRTSHWTAWAIESAGFEVRDVVMHVFATGFPKSADISKHLDAMARKKWLDVAAAIDGADMSAILSAWKESSKAASSAALLFAKNETATGTNTAGSGFVPATVALQVNPENSDAVALLAELCFTEARRTSGESRSARTLVVDGERQGVAKSVALSQRSDVPKSWGTGTVPVVVKEWQSESMAGRLRGAEALKTWLGSRKSSTTEDTSALCAALTADLKHTILSRSETYRNADTIQQTAFASAIAVTITESTAASLISFTADTARREAIDAAAGAEREVVSERKLTGKARVLSGSDYNGDYADCRDTPRSFEEVYQETSPATDAARQWSGWGTALKPSAEMWVLAQKPIDTMGNCAILIRGLTERIESCRRNVRRVGSSSEPSRADSSGAKIGSVLGGAATPQEGAPGAVTETGGAGDTCSRADTSASMSAEGGIVLSTLLSWRGALGVLYAVARTSTTSTETEATTVSKTLSYLLSEVTPGAIIRAACLPSGSSASAENAAVRFNAGLARLQSILTPSALDDATRQAASLFASAGTLPLAANGQSAELSPAAEHWILARKPIEGTVAANVLRYGTGGINIDGCRIGTESTVRNNHGGTGNPTRWRTGSGDDFSSGGSQGRFPANLIHDGSDEVLAGFPSLHGAGNVRPSTMQHANPTSWRLPPQTKNPDYHGNQGGSAARFFRVCQHDAADSARRFRYCAKADRADRDKGLDGVAHKTAGEVTGGRGEGSAGLDCPRAGAGRTSGGRNNHPTVKATDLMRYLCRLITPTGGLVLDPFTGSGSTGKAAMLEGFRFVGIEQDPGYFAIARRRIEAELAQGVLPFDEPEPKEE